MYAFDRIIHPVGWREPVGLLSRAGMIGDHLYSAGSIALAHVNIDYYERVLPKTIEEHFRWSPPTSTCSQVPLRRGDILVEIEAGALIPAAADHWLS
jgi:hypothetical protein